MEDELANYAQVNARNFWTDAGDAYLNRGFPLSSGSKVIDVGGYKGDWTAYITRMHDCWVDVYEPLEEYCAYMKKRFAANPKVHIWETGLESKDGRTPIGFMEDSSSFYRPMRADSPYVRIADVSNVIGVPIDLMAINCEGSEYQILERMMKCGNIKYIKHLLIQFHTFVPNAKEKREAILESLRKTHQQRWCYPFVWEAWTKNYRSDE